MLETSVECPRDNRTVGSTHIPPLARNPGPNAGRAIWLPRRCFSGRESRNPYQEVSHEYDDVEKALVCEAPPTVLPLLRAAGESCSNLPTFGFSAVCSRGFAIHNGVFAVIETHKVDSSPRDETLGLGLQRVGSQ